VYYIELECLNIERLLSILYEKGSIDYYEMLECYKETTRGGSFDLTEFYRCLEMKK